MNELWPKHEQSQDFMPTINKEGENNDQILGVTWIYTSNLENLSMRQTM